jgi:TolB protein
VTGDEPEYYGAILELRNGKPERFTPKGFNVGSVKWSPDGAAIAFDAVIGDNFDLYVADTGGLNLQRLTQSPAIDARPEWSPDGTKLLLNSTRDFGSVHGDDQWDHFELYLLDLETRKVRRLTENDKFDAHPDWCVDSERG